MSNQTNNQNKTKQYGNPIVAYDSPMGAHIPPKQTNTNTNTKPQPKK